MRAREIKRLFGRLSTEKEGDIKVPAAYASVEEKNFEKFMKGKRFSIIEITTWITHLTTSGHNCSWRLFLRSVLW